MFLLIWIILLFPVRHTNTYSDWGKEHCFNAGSGQYCITLHDGIITAEAGLCVVIPCSFTTGYYFNPTNIVWSRCELSKRQCEDSDAIFASSNTPVQSGFTGRVSMLEPDMRQRNCGIMINDITKSDSGSYQLRVNGFLNGRADKYVFRQKTTVSVKGLTQRPTVMVPPLTEGQQSTLTCTAPGLCSGSPPEFQWTWGGKGQKDSNISENTIKIHTENLSAVTQRHSSTLTFNPSAKHHNMKIICKISFTGNLTKKETVTLNVSYIKQITITGETRVKEGETLNLNCSVESFPSSVVTWSKSGTQNNILTHQSEEQGVSCLNISNVTVEVSGFYICTAKYVDRTLTKEINVTVMYMREPQIDGNVTVKEGDNLTLTCSVDSVPPSRVIWTKHLQNDALTNQREESGINSLVISNATQESSGLYVCTITYLNKTFTKGFNMTVTWFSNILKGSGCVHQSDVLTCVCITEGFPLPTITWPLLKDHTKYSLTTRVLNHTVNSTVTIKHHGNISVECFSSNENGEVKETLMIKTNLPEKEGQTKNIIKSVSRLEVITAFLVGVLLSAIICCLAKKCYRGKQKKPENLDETLEMMTGLEDPLMSEGHIVHDNKTHVQKGTENEAVAAEKVVPESNCGSNDVEYASIDFSKLKKKSFKKAVKERESTTTEYAEIKTGLKEESKGSVKEDGEKLKCEDEELMMNNGMKIKQCVSEEQGGEVEAVYSTVKDVMDEM